MTTFLKDRTYWLALIAPILFWVTLLLFAEAPSDFRWPLKTPLPFLLLAVVYPVLEEIAFRGWLQENLHRYFKHGTWGGFSKANILTSIVFTAFHFLYHAPLWAASVFVPSLIFGYFKDRHQSLVSPIVLHVYYNTGYYLLFFNPHFQGFAD